MSPRKILLPGENPSESEPNLTEAAPAFIKAEINSGFDSIRSGNEQQFKDLRGRIRKQWMWLTIASWVVTALFGLSFYSLWKDIPKRVRSQFVEPKVKETVTRVIQEKSSAYVDDKLRPLDKTIEEASQTVKTIEEGLNAKAQRLDAAETELASRLLIHEQATAAKAGDLDAYNKVLAAAANPPSINASANAELREIEMYYDMDAAQLMTIRWADTIFWGRPGIFSG